jgi:hypothetical protein
MEVEHRGDPARGFRVPMPRSKTWFYPEDPRPGEFHVEDIAHKLAHQCRYGGGTKHFYSVAHHCILLSYLVPPALAYEALMHDRAEAYLQDFIRPVKAKCQPWYGELERRIEEVSAPVFGVTFPNHPDVMTADYRICIDEKRLLIPCEFHAENEVEDGEGFNLTSTHFLPMSPERAYEAFLERYNELRAAA